MADRIRMTAPPALPPLRYARTAARPLCAVPDAARLARLALCLAALALPVLGSGAADTVRRGDAPGTWQTAILPPPSGRTTVAQASRSVPAPREAALALRRAAPPHQVERLHQVARLHQAEVIR